MAPWSTTAFGLMCVGTGLPSASETNLERYSPTQRAPQSSDSTKICVPGAKGKAPILTSILAGLGIIAAAVLALALTEDAAIRRAYVKRMNNVLCIFDCMVGTSFCRKSRFRLAITGMPLLQWISYGSGDHFALLNAAS